MPHSKRDNDRDVRNYVIENRVMSVLDVGAGSGTYGRLLEDLVPGRHAIEAWGPYVEQFGLRDVYNYGVWVGDVRLEDTRRAFGPWHDLVIFGDVLEHMTLQEGLDVWAWAATVARRGLISVPTVDWPQGHEHGNPHEEHVQDLVAAEDWERHFGPFDEVHRYAETATFMKEF